MRVFTLQSLSCLAASKALLGTGAYGDLGTNASRSQALMEKRKGRKSQLSGRQKLFSFLHQDHSSHRALDEVALPLYSVTKSLACFSGVERGKTQNTVASKGGYI